MLINKKITLKSLWLFGKKNILQTLALSTLVVVIYQVLEFKFIAIPFLPGAALPIQAEP